MARADADYGLAHETPSRGLDAIEDAAGVIPRGFIAPCREVNAATLRVGEELDIEWALGRTDAKGPRNSTFANRPTRTT